MKVEFLDPAVQELYEAINFYNVQPNGLGQEFAEEVENAIERIRQNPEAWTVVSSSKRARRYLTNRFPYGIIYQIRPDVF